ncbi:SDR family NAD(P)-dependent oxidoreductase [uncultured Bacteroides sp.]|uniref:SDR family NAD(P)-dependent oxidoreductase n=1 Tax=uncultured Bacteroides sp. TaxID=162156 RepID=UPI00262BF75E|nr:SDR family NAD(P)-dependent oxidoreductase [uncultured Bacteroides sp.]
MINKTKRAVIMGATSGIGYEVARLLLSEGWKLGLAGRREENLRKLQSEFPGQVCIKAIDVKDEDAGNALFSLIDELGGMDMYFHSSGIGYQNANLDADIELNTLETNGTGFTRMVGAAFRYFRDKGKGHIAVISSIAGTKGLGIAPAYSATKRFQNTYIDALEQLASMKKLDIRFTDIRPGFVATNLLNDGKKYPMLMKTDYTARLIVKALNRKKRIAVIDWKYRILVFFWRLIPRCVWKRMSVKN